MQERLLEEEIVKMMENPEQVWQNHETRMPIFK